MRYRDAARTRRALQELMRTYPPGSTISLEVALGALGPAVGNRYAEDVRTFLEDQGYHVLDGRIPNVPAVSDVVAPTIDGSKERPEESAQEAPVSADAEDRVDELEDEGLHPSLDWLADADIDTLLDRPLRPTVPLEGETWANNRARLEYYYHSHDPGTRAALVEANQKLVRSLASYYLKYPGNTLEFDDLVSEGMIGLLEAIERFDPGLGTEFSTYAVFWIRQHIVRAICDTGLAVRIPIHIRELIARILRVQAAASVSGRPANAQSVADLVGISFERYYRAKTAYDCFFNHTSLSTPIGDDEGAVLADVYVDAPNRATTLGDTSGDPEDVVMNAETSSLLRQALGTLSERQRFVLEQRFADDPKTLEQIGNALGITRERVRQIEKKALERIRRVVACRDYEALSS